MKVSLESFVPLPPGGVKKGKDDTYEDHLESEAMMQVTQDALQDLLGEVVSKNPTPDGLDSVVKVRSPQGQYEKHIRSVFR